VPLTEPRVPANQTYTIKVQFAAPLTETPTAVLQGQPGTANVTGVAGATTLDPTQTIMTVQLTGVANAQALDLHLSNINTTLTRDAVQDISFNVLTAMSARTTISTALTPRKSRCKKLAR
jgi:hypothetical protein